MVFFLDHRSYGEIIEPDKFIDPDAVPDVQPDSKADKMQIDEAPEEDRPTKIIAENITVCIRSC